MSSKNRFNTYRINSPECKFDLEIHENDYYPYKLENIQKYNPIYSLFLDESNLETVSPERMALNHKFHILDLEHIVNTETNETIQKEVFIKFSPLLDPVRFLIGKYKSTPQNSSLRRLPKMEYSEFDHPKLSNPNNASYVDNFFCYLSSQLLNTHHFKNAIDFYGSLLGVQEKFKINVIDDIEYLNQSDHFLNTRNELYEMDEMGDPFANFGSRRNRNKIEIHNQSAVSLFSVEDLEIVDVDGLPPTEECVLENDSLLYEKNESAEDKTEEYSDDDSSNNSEINYTSDEDEGEGESENSEDSESEGEYSSESANEDSENDSSEEPSLYAYIKDFPVQMICLEKCEGTLDDLFIRGEIDEVNGASALFQTIMSLLAYQKAFHFTHNDLHTNNIMYVKTDEEFLFYKYDGKMYKVPTHGKIFKIIDFGRAIYKFDGRTYCSDSFGPEGDASTQYNFGPYMNPKKPRLEPNYSFDLCRLGCSIFDFILDEDFIDEDPSEMDELQRTIIRWCRDDNGKNILYKTNGDERYPNFKLYKMIARTVHEHTPANQLVDPYFSQFLCKEKDVPSSSNIVDLDRLPCYA